MLVLGKRTSTHVPSTSNIAAINSTTFKWRAREGGKTIKTVGRVSCEHSRSNEKAQILNDGFQSDEENLVSVPCSFDMGWQKTGKGRNSHTGHAAVTSLTISVKSWMTLHDPNKAADTAVVTMAKIATAATTIKEIKKSQCFIRGNGACLSCGDF